MNTMTSTAAPNIGRRASPALFACTLLAAAVLSSLAMGKEASTASKLPALPLDSTADYLVYYGSWDEDKLFRAMDFNVVILEPSNITAAQVAELRKGHDGISGTDDDVLVFGYLSIGEDNSGTRTGNGMGPCYYNLDSAKVVYEHKGVASWYVDDSDKNGAPDENSTWGSYYVNAGDSLWWAHLKTFSSGADYTLTVLNCDGLFLDTIDSASPWSSWPYCWTVVGMSDLVAWLRATYPTKYLFGNRGLFYFNPSYTTAYAHTIRPYVDAIMYESYYLDDSRAQWASLVQIEAKKSDGFKVVALDYATATDTATIKAQMAEVASLNWADYISSSSLDEIRYDVFHRHAVDTNPPTWNSSIGVAAVTPGDRSVTLKWNGVTDQSLPVTYTISYGPESSFSLDSATTISGVVPEPDSASGAYSYTITQLTNYTTYAFVVRARDALGNQDKNTRVRTATPPSGSSSVITIDGDFTDWASVPALNTAPNTTALGSDTLSPNGDFSGVWASSDSATLFLSYAVTGALSSSYYYHVFLDTDGLRSTGYTYQDSASVGAEFMIEGDVLYGYSGSGGSSWGWTGISGMTKSNSGGRTELSIPLSVLGLSGTAGANVHVMFETNLVESPYSLVDVAPAKFGAEYYGYTISGTTAITEKPATAAARFNLAQNYPNPFNPMTTIGYSVEGSGSNRVRLSVYDMLGREVAILVDDDKASGEYQVRFDARGLASGVYYARLVEGSSAAVRSMLLLK